MPIIAGRKSEFTPRGMRLGSVRRALAAATLCAVSWQALADPQPATFSGVPQQVIPTYPEVGLGSFTMPTGTSSLLGGPGGTDGGDGASSGGGDGSSYVAASYSQYVGQSVGSGECVALVQAADPAVGLTRTWVQGQQVQGATDLQPGTIIATFDSSGRYANATDGSSHAAIYLGQNDQGIQVLDQWAGSPAAIRTIRWSNPNGTAANTGSAFYVVSHAS